MTANPRRILIINGGKDTRNHSTNNPVDSVVEISSQAVWWVSVVPVLDPDVGYERGVDPHPPLVHVPDLHEVHPGVGLLLARHPVVPGGQVLLLAGLRLLRPAAGQAAVDNHVLEVLLHVE